MPIFRIDDIAAAVVLSMTMLRRLETLRVEPAQYPEATPEAFRTWRSMALGGYNLAAASCALKVIVSQLWFRYAFERPLLLSIGGLSIFVTWIIVVVVAWRRITEARALRAEMNNLGASPRR